MKPHFRQHRKQFVSAAFSLLVAITSWKTRAQSPALPNLAFASDRSGRFQVYQVQIPPPGQPVPAPIQITTAGSGSQQSRGPDWSKNGKIAYQFGASGVRGIHMINPDGSADVRLTFTATDEFGPSWSPDGQYIVYASSALGDYDLRIHKVGDPNTLSDDDDYLFLRLVPTNPAQRSQETRPAWSPDGKKIALVTTFYTGQGQIIVVDFVPDPRNPGRFMAANLNRLTINTFDDMDPTWSPDGQQIAFSSSRTGGRDIYRMDAQNGESFSLMQLTTNTAGDQNPSWSPDGKLIAFSTDRNGNREIYVMSAVAGEADSVNLLQITNDPANDNDPAWEQVIVQKTDLVAVSLDFDTIQRGVNFSYDITNADLTIDTTAALYWATGRDSRRQHHASGSRDKYPAITDRALRTLLCTDFGLGKYSRKCDLFDIWHRSIFSKRHRR